MLSSQDFIFGRNSLAVQAELINLDMTSASGPSAVSTVLIENPSDSDEDLNSMVVHEDEPQPDIKLSELIERDQNIHMIPEESTSHEGMPPGMDFFSSSRQSNFESGMGDAPVITESTSQTVKDSKEAECPFSDHNPFNTEHITTDAVLDVVSSFDEKLAEEKSFTTKASPDETEESIASAVNTKAGLGDDFVDLASQVIQGKMLDLIENSNPFAAACEASKEPAVQADTDHLFQAESGVHEEIIIPRSQDRLFKATEDDSTLGQNLNASLIDALDNMCLDDGSMVVDPIEKTPDQQSQDEVLIQETTVQFSPDVQTIEHETVEHENLSPEMQTSKPEVTESPDVPLQIQPVETEAVESENVPEPMQSFEPETTEPGNVPQESHSIAPETTEPETATPAAAKSAQPVSSAKSAEKTASAKPSSPRVTAATTKTATQKTTAPARTAPAAAKTATTAATRTATSAKPAFAAKASSTTSAAPAKASSAAKPTAAKVGTAAKPPAAKTGVTTTSSTAKVSAASKVTARAPVSSATTASKVSTSKADGDGSQKPAVSRAPVKPASAAVKAPTAASRTAARPASSTAAASANAKPSTGAGVAAKATTGATAAAATTKKPAPTSATNRVAAARAAASKTAAKPTTAPSATTKPKVGSAAPPKVGALSAGSKAPPKSPMKKAKPAGETAQKVAKISPEDSDEKIAIDVASEVPHQNGTNGPTQTNGHSHVILDDDSAQPSGDANIGVTADGNLVA